jgi:hormone-sensitive lipase
MTQDIKLEYQRFLSIIYGGNSMTCFGSKFKKYGKVIERVCTHLSSCYYFIFKEQAKRTTHLFYAKPNEDAFEVWSMLDQIMPLFEMTLTPVEVNSLYYLPRVYPKITLELLDAAIQNGTINNPDQSIFTSEDQFPLKKKSYTVNDIKINKKHAIQIRVISPFELSTSDKKGENISNEEIDVLMIHIHGGGWVSMSSGMHQIYLRHWANDMRIPFFSIDYERSPQARYPKPLDDCWQAYNWLVDNCHVVFGVNPKKIIVMGDSAGANMGLGITSLAIKSKTRAPDGIFLAYPALNLRMDIYSPSLTEAVTDEIVPFSFLALCLLAYNQDQERPKKDPILSPSLLSDEMLEKFPPVRIGIGTNDPVHDECWRFMERFVNLKKDIKIHIWEDLIHGILNFDMVLGMPVALDTVKDSEILLADLIRAGCEKK